MSAVAYPSSRVLSERTIAVARVVLAATALFAVWIDPPNPAEHAPLTYSLYWVYVIYSAVLAGASFRRDVGEWMPLATHVTDILAFSVFQYFTLGLSSPFFVYFIFSMFCGAIRWGWRGTLATGGVVMLFYVAMAHSLSRWTGGSAIELNRFVVRLAYLSVATFLLVYLGRYEARLRSEIERLARWPAPLATDGPKAIGRILEYAGRLMQAGHVLVVWETDDEPAMHEARWSHGTFTLHRHAPDALPLLAGEALTRSTFICTGPARDATSIQLPDHAGRLVRQAGMPLTTYVLDRLEGAGLATAPLRTAAISGRVFFSDLGTPPAEAVPLTEAVAREIASSLDQIHAAARRQELATREERIRVARDLHDGVLQSLTGVRLELRALAKTSADCTDRLRTQLLSLERALAMEQRELRFFISGLGPEFDRPLDRPSTLALVLDSVRERLALEWKTPVTLRVSPDIVQLPESLEEAIPMMVHEAAVNALKHAHPSRVSVNVDTSGGQLRVTVSDDGGGFPFRGRYTHETLAASHAAPRSLFDRVTTLGGRLDIESSDHGSRVEMLLSL